jgi:hypothetical protein
VIALKILPDQSIFITGTFGDYYGGPRADVYVARMDMGSGLLEVRTFSGPWSDAVYYLALTANGSAYIAGRTQTDAENHTELLYLRQAF